MNDTNYDEIIDYDGVIQQDGDGFAILPDGDDVTFTISDVEKCYNKEGTKPQVKLSLSCTSNNGHGKTTVVDYITMTRKSEWKLCEFFRAIGLRQHGEALKCRWDIVGLGGTATVALEKYTKRDGSEGANNKIKRYLTPSTAPQHSASPAQTSFM